MLPGAGLFFFLTHGRILNPSYTEWMMLDDPATHFLGWQFFRHTEFWQWPLGANPGYGMELSSTIVFSDTIPLLAFLLRPFSSFLPKLFQFTGFWILACMILQAFFAWKLLSLFIRDRVLLLAGTVLFTLAPIYIWRITGHFTLAAHWLLLAGFCLYFGHKFLSLQWMILLVLASLINPYILAMVLAIWIFDLLQRSFGRQLTVTAAAGSFLGTGAVLFLVMWAVGYFVPGTNFSETGFGYYRMNLLSPIDSDGLWSWVVKDQKGRGGDYEGFNYLGLGVIILAVSGGFKFIISPRIKDYVRLVPLGILAVSLTLFAVSNKIGIGGLEIVSYDLPDSIRFLTSTFRSSGRFFWPVYYLILLASIYLVSTRFGRKEARVLCLLVLSVQFADSSKAWSYYQTRFSEPASWSNPLRSPRWEEFAADYDKLILVPPENAPEHWMSLARYASIHKMSTNAGYFARVGQDRIEAEGLRLSREVLGGKLDPEALYVIRSEALWDKISGASESPDWYGTLDGFRIIAPGRGKSFSGEKIGH